MNPETIIVEWRKRAAELEAYARDAAESDPETADRFCVGADTLQHCAGELELYHKAKQ